MKTRMVLVGVILIAIILPIGVSFALNYLNYVNGTGPKIVWERTGGFMGLYEKLIIANDGSILYLSNYYYNITELVITKAELEDLLNKAEFFTKNISYTAKPNAADYFVYKLTVETSSGNKTIEWVDAWASEETLPPELKDLQDQILIIIERLHYLDSARLSK